MKPILCLLVALAAAADSLPVEGRTLQEAAKPTKPPSAISRFLSTVSPEQKTKLSTIMKEQRKLKDMADSAAKVCAPAHTELARLDSLRVSPHTPTCELAGTRQPASLCRHASPAGAAERDEEAAERADQGPPRHEVHATHRPCPPYPFSHRPAAPLSS